MAYTEQVSRTGILADVMRRIVDAALPAALPAALAAALAHDGFAARPGPRKFGRHPGGPLDAGILRDTGARREVHDYAASAAVSACPDRRLHRIAEAARWSSLG